MLVPGDHPPDVDALLVELEEADAAVRALYRELAADPDLAGAYEPRLKDLHTRRLTEHILAARTRGAWRNAMATPTINAWRASRATSSRTSYWTSRRSCMPWA
jgi:hypothetical protein